MNEAITTLYAVLERAATGLPRRILMLAVAASTSAVFNGFGVQAQTPAVTGVIHTVEGDVQGFSTNGVSEFLGIPYAAPPVGNLRWQPPQPAARRHFVYRLNRFDRQRRILRQQLAH